MTQEIKCPCCCNVLTPDSEQAICVELFGECIFCRFSPNSKGSKSGTQAELAHIVVRQEAKRRFNNQQPKTIDMQKLVGSGAPAVPDTESAYQRGYLDGMAKRPQPLTGEQIVEIYTKWESQNGSSWADLMRAVEAAHDIKETEK